MFDRPALLDQSGHARQHINDPDERYSLQSLPSKFLGLHLLAIMCAAIQHIHPSMATGVDSAADYKVAVQMHSA